MAVQPVVCPIHGTGENIQRVSGVVAGGQSHGTFSGPTGGVVNVDGKWGTSGGYTSLSGTSVTNLAASLTPPREPKKRAFGWIATLSMAYVWFILSGWGIFAPIGLWLDSYRVARVNGITVGADGAVLLIGAIILTLVCLMICLAGVWWYLNKNRKVKAAYPSKKLAWDEAMARWNRAYYCFRDDIVFDPDTGESCRPQDFAKFLYAHT